MKRFTRRNEGFACEECGRDVAPGSHGVNRNHCPFCLCSKHCDQRPGDRMAECGGLMKAIEAYYKGGQVVLVHECQRCGTRKNNHAAQFPCDPADDWDLILKLMERAAWKMAQRGPVG